jgi:hypothetical protein
VKIFQLNDYEFWIGPDLESCIAAAMKEWGVTREDAIDDPAEIAGDALDKYTVNLDENEDPNGETITFREGLAREIAAGGEFPRFFCGIAG